MLKIEKTVLPSPEQWEIIIEGMRNPHNSWDRMDSYATYIEDPETLETAPYEYFIGENDAQLMETLAKGGPVHAKYRRMIPVWVTVTAPLYWWKEFDTYKVGTVANSCSTMHKIHAKEFFEEDFSFEKIEESFDDYTGDYGINTAYVETQHVVGALNRLRYDYLRTKDKKYWYAMIQLLPSSYNQTRTIFLTYEVLYNQYEWRRNHKLTEWHTWCDWIEGLPYSELITMKFEKDIQEFLKKEFNLPTEFVERKCLICKENFYPPADSHQRICQACRDKAKRKDEGDGNLSEDDIKLVEHVAKELGLDDGKEYEFRIV